MAGTAKTRAQLGTAAAAPFLEGSEPGNQDFQDLFASFYNLLDDPGAVPWAYKGTRSAMTGNETFVQADGNFFARDPGGANRNFDPSGSFAGQAFVVLVNLADADETITFDSAGAAIAVREGERAIFGRTALDGWLLLAKGRVNQFSAGTMTANETFRQAHGPVFERDPGGAARNFNPSGAFAAGHEVVVINTADAAETITFDSAGIAAAIAQGQHGRFVYNGSAWRKLYVGAWS